MTDDLESKEQKQTSGFTSMFGVVQAKQAEAKPAQEKTVQEKMEVRRESSGFTSQPLVPPVQSKPEKPVSKPSRPPPARQESLAQRMRPMANRPKMFPEADEPLPDLKAKGLFRYQSLPF